jgi:hypothetical protein
MFIVDDILMAPFKGVLWVFEEIHKAAKQERQNETESITVELQKLYMSLESGAISEEEFDQREAQLLDRLDSLQEVGAVIDEEDDEDDEEYDEEDDEDDEDSDEDEEFESGSSIQILNSEPGDDVSDA